ncbi:hypothetical protein [Streptomyces sp. MNU89]|uniref:NucA/NucB deoxyribonuclease domain-containing protein n=1 Tax=Streptomyces sp. MNU89 TaxID=2560025 RepID=UPI001E529169|nr:hypothetical protein [Streptomyces sp. MNU89]MCC9738478.1 hypothetical protein [Streptomyces sp. MNU89]
MHWGNMQARSALGAVGAVLCLLTASIVGAGHASADVVPTAADSLTVRTHALPPGAQPPTLAELRADADAGEQKRFAVREAQARIPREFVGPATVGEPVAQTPSSLSAEARGELSPLAATYPQPSRTMTQGECKQGLQGGKVFYLKSRFAMCAGTQFVQTWAKNGRPVGQSSFTLWVISTVPSRTDRTVHYRYLFTDFFKAGTTQTSGLKINTDADLKTWPSRTTKKQGGEVPPTKSFDALKANPEYLHTMLHEPGEGRGKDDVVTMAYQPFVTVTFPAPYLPPQTGRTRVGFLIAQWDKASYLFNKNGGGNPKKAGGAAFPVLVYLPYSAKAGASEQAVAQHLDDAHRRPATTKPENPDKIVPGFGTKQPLHRLHHNEQRRNANRSTAVATCTKYWGSDYATSDPAGPRECDEFPFASTYEGAAHSRYNTSMAKDNYSARPLRKSDNGAAGNILASFLNRNRIVDGYIDEKEDIDHEVDAYSVHIS